MHADAGASVSTQTQLYNLLQHQIGYQNLKDSKRGERPDYRLEAFDIFQNEIELSDSVVSSELR